MDEAELQRQNTRHASTWVAYRFVADVKRTLLESPDADNCVLFATKDDLQDGVDSPRLGERTVHKEAEFLNVVVRLCSECIAAITTNQAGLI